MDDNFGFISFLFFLFLFIVAALFGGYTYKLGYKHATVDFAAQIESVVDNKILEAYNKGRSDGMALGTKMPGLSYQDGYRDAITLCRAIKDSKRNNK